MPDLRAISALFQMRGAFVEAQVIGAGHINDTFCAVYEEEGRRVRYIHQRVNSNVFKNPILVMENVARVTQHALSRLLAEAHPEAYRRTLTCVLAQDGKPYAMDAEGELWRTYLFIEGAKGYEEIETHEQAYQVAKAFGSFQLLTADLGGERLHETIPHFHDTPRRLAALEEAIQVDPHGRAARLAPEIAFVRARAEDCSRITDLIANGKIPERVTHNDTKLNNVLLDEVTSEGICVIDLDTTMPGSALYDFGDMVRTVTPSLREDEMAPSQLFFRHDRFEALVRGYLSTATFLNAEEIDQLAFSGKLLTLECGIRFLTDYLLGDPYFKIKRPEHNLDRCRNQFAFVRVLEQEMPALEEVVARVVGELDHF